MSKAILIFLMIVVAGCSSRPKHYAAPRIEGGFVIMPLNSGYEAVYGHSLDEDPHSGSGSVKPDAKEAPKP